MKEHKIPHPKGAIIVRMEAPEIGAYRTRYAYSVEVEGVGSVAKTGAVYAGYKHRYQITRYAHSEGFGHFPSPEVCLEVERALDALVEAYGTEAIARERGLERARFLRSRVISNRLKRDALSDEIRADLAELSRLPDPYPDHPLDPGA